MAYDFKAGTLSVNGLIPALGTTAEVQDGLMSIASKTAWLNKLTSKGLSTGPTGAWKNEWLAVYQFLDYGYGTCHIGGTGSTGSYTNFSLTNTPLHNSSLVTLDVVFDAGNTFSASAAANIANSRQDCVALIGNKSNITNITSNYSSESNDFGFTLADSEYVSYIAGRKQIDTRVSSSLIWPSSYISINCSPDIAGLMALNSNLTDISTIVAGVGTSKTIKNVISLNQIFSDTEAENLKTNNINPIRQYSGIGVFLMGNKTYKNNSSLITNRLNVMVTLNYIKRNVKTILQEYLFGPNNAIIRETISNRITNFLKDLYIFSSVGGGTFTVICNDTNNTSATISAGSLVVDINLVLPPSTETITLNVVNTEDGSTVYTVNLV
jgi:hypothetical protein